MMHCQFFRIGKPVGICVRKDRAAAVFLFGSIGETVAVMILQAVRRSVFVAVFCPGIKAQLQKFRPIRQAVAVGIRLLRVSLQEIFHCVRKSVAVPVFRIFPVQEEADQLQIVCDRCFEVVRLQGPPLQEPGDKFIAFRGFDRRCRRLFAVLHALAFRCLGSLFRITGKRDPMSGLFRSFAASRRSCAFRCLTAAFRRSTFPASAAAAAERVHRKQQGQCKRGSTLNYLSFLMIHCFILR